MFSSQGVSQFTFDLAGVGHWSGTAEWADIFWPRVCWRSGTPSEWTTKRQRSEWRRTWKLTMTGWYTDVTLVWITADNFYSTATRLAADWLEIKCRFHRRVSWKWNSGFQSTASREADPWTLTISVSSASLSCCLHSSLLPRRLPATPPHSPLRQTNKFGCISMLAWKDADWFNGRGERMELRVHFTLA